VWRTRPPPCSSADPYRPAIYLNTGFVREYYLAEGGEECVDEEGRERKPPWDEGGEEPRDPRTDMLADIIPSKTGVDDFSLIRRLVGSRLTSVSLVFTPITLLELYKWRADEAMADICSEMVGAACARGFDERMRGTYLAKIFALSDSDDKNKTAKQIRQDCTFAANSPGLDGTVCADVQLSLNAGAVHRVLWPLSFVQLQTVDILHLHAAHALGCEYFASLDPAVSDNRDLIERLGIRLLCGPKEVIAVLKAHQRPE
jgi:hypothetical protein